MRVIRRGVVIVNQSPVAQKSFCKIDEVLILDKAGSNLRKISALNAFVEFTNGDALGQLAAKDCARTAIGPAGLFKNLR